MTPIAYSLPWLCRLQTLWDRDCFFLSACVAPSVIGPICALLIKVATYTCVFFRSKSGFVSAGSPGLWVWACLSPKERSLLQKSNIALITLSP